MEKLRGVVAPVRGVKVVRPIFLSLVLVAGMAGCSTSAPKPRAAFDEQLAASVSKSAGDAAAAKTGAKVCRWVELGISERSWVRGVVQQTDAGGAVRVRIEDPGRFANSLNGTQLARGALVSDKAVAWTPCTF